MDSQWQRTTRQPNLEVRATMVDALIKTLNEIGYQAVVLPRTGLTPPDLYGYYKPYLRWYGPLKAHFNEDVTFSFRMSSHPNIEHVATTRKSYEAASQFLGKALTCLGIIAPPLPDLSFIGKRGIRFLLSRVTSKTVDPTQLFNILERFNQGGIPDEIVINKQLHIAYEYMYAESLLMSRADDIEIGIDISADLSDVINLGIEVGFKTSNKTTISFSRLDSPPVAFAYKAGLLDHVDGKWQFYPEQVIRRRAGAGEGKQPFIPVKGVYLELEPDNHAVSV